MLKRLLAVAATAALALGPAARVADAAVYVNGSSTATFLVSLTLQANCSISANSLAFGSTGVLTNALNQQSTVSVTCTNTTPYNVGLDAGNVTGSSIATRLMAGTATGNTGTTVSFQIYQDAGRSTLWGNTQGSNTVAGVGNGAAQTITAYGQVPAQTTPKPDNYQTTVTATVYF